MKQFTIKLLKFVPFYFWFVAAVLLLIASSLPEGCLVSIGVTEGLGYTGECGLLACYMASFFVLLGLVWWWFSRIKLKKGVKRIQKANN